MPLGDLRHRKKFAPGVLKQSAHLMRAQSKCKREKFDSWPDFVRRTVHHADSTEFEASWRSLPVEERLPLCEQLRAAGNELYRAGQYEDAIDKYAQAAGLFHYVQKTGLTSDGSLDDNYLSLVTDERGQDTSPVPGARAMRVACYSNIAQCLLRQGKQSSEAARRACDEALALDPTNAKALYRRAMAFEGMGSVAALNSAMQDLGQASELEPSDASVQAARHRITAELRKQRRAEQRMFRGFLDRDSNGIGGSEDRERAAARDIESEAAAAAEGEDIQQTIDEATKLREAYISEGRAEDALDMEKRIDILKDRLAERRDRDFDIFQPSAELVLKAKRFGIDLRDPSERRKVDRLMWEAHRATQGELDEMPPEKSSNSRLRKQALTRAKDVLLTMVVISALCWAWMLARQFLH